MAGVGAFAVGDEADIAAAGEDEDRSAGVLAVRGIDGEGGDGDVGETDDAMAADECVGGFGGVGFGVCGAGRLGGAVRPEGKREGLGLRVGGRGECGGEEGEDCEAESGGQVFHAHHLSLIPRERRGLSATVAWRDWLHRGKQFGRYACGFTLACGSAVSVCDAAGLWHG